MRSQMKFNFISPVLLTLLIVITKSNLYAQTPLPKAPTKNMPSQTLYRIYADYNYVMANPINLNDYGTSLTWGGTTRSTTTFSNLNGFTGGAGYKMDQSYLGAEYSYATQELPKTTILPGPNTIQYSFDYLSLYLVYDRVFDINETQSYEIGGGLGYALYYRYHWLQSSSTSTEEVIWQSNPIVAKIRATYNYALNDSFKIRVGATYEYAKSSSLSSDSAHPLIQGIVAGQALRNNGQDVTVDMSGLRLNAGLAFVF